MEPPVASTETVATTEPAAAPDDLPADVDRKVAEWVLSIGGQVFVNFDFERKIKDVSELPNEPFFVASIWLGQNQQVSDRDLPRFKGCQGMWLLDLTGTQVTDAGLARVRALAAMLPVDPRAAQFRRAAPVAPARSPDGPRR